MLVKLGSGAFGDVYKGTLDESPIGGKPQFEIATKMAGDIICNAFATCVSCFHAVHFCAHGRRNCTPSAYWNVLPDPRSPPQERYSAVAL